MNCYLCNSGNSTIRKGKVRGALNAKIHQCGGCGLVFLSGISEIDYQEGGMHEGSISGKSVEDWLRESAEDDQRRIEKFKTQITGKSVLDFGCGAGGFLLRARDYASFSVGVELESRLVGHFQSEKLEVFADIDDLELGKTFEVITAFHVVEHLTDPRSTLRKLKGRLAKEGDLIIEVPNADDALLTLFESTSFSNFTYWSCHPYLYNASTLERLAEQANLRLKGIEYVQRYPLSNHLYWLAKGEPGGHRHWDYLNSPDLTSAYENVLAEIGKSDTIIGSFSH